MIRFQTTRTVAGNRAKRKGNALVLAAGSLVMVFAFVAFTADLGYIVLTKAELQRASDAGALGAVLELHDATGKAPLVSWSDAEANARQAAVDVAAANRGGGLDSVYVDHSRDVRFGQYTHDPATGAWTKTWGATPYNMVEVTTRRDQANSNSGDSPLDLFFAPILGRDQADVVQSSTAVMFAGTGFHKIPGLNIGILPITLDKPTWDDLINNNVGTDNFTWNEATGTITPGGDGVLEVNLYPYGPQTLMPGNRGTVDFGDSGNATSDLTRQILYGLNDDDFAALLAQGIPELNFDNGPLLINGDTGISAGIQNELDAIKGEPRAIPLFTNIAANGNNATYTIVEFVGIRIMNVKLSGGNKRVIIQPAPYSDAAVVPSDGPIMVDSIFAPGSLVP